PHAEAAEAPAGRIQCGPVAVDAEHGEVRPALEQPFAVATAADGRVEHPAGRDRGEQLDDLGGHHREVFEPHHCLPNRWTWRAVRRSAAPRPTDAAGMSPRSTRRKRAE